MPTSFVKGNAQNLLYQSKAFHLKDYESNDNQHIIQFKRHIDNIKEASRINAKVKYSLAYCNYSFDLWIVLHKSQHLTSYNHRGQYLSIINRVFNESYIDMDEYKKERNFKKILSQITLDDVKDAIHRSEGVIEYAKSNGFMLQNYKNCYYYRENPTLSIHEAIKQIFNDIKL